MAAGILEELFIAGAPGSKQVYFRNYSVTASLGLSGDWGGAQPESVVWGVNHDRFVVRTGTTTATQKYFQYSIARALNSVFDPGVIPSPILVRTDTPYTSLLALFTSPIAVSVTDTEDWRTVKTQSNGHLVPEVPPVACDGVVDTLAITVNYADSIVISGTVSYTPTLTTVLAGAATVQYALNANNELILLVIGPVPSSAITNGTKVQTKQLLVVGDCANATFDNTNVAASVSSLVPRNEQHCWLVNFTVGSVLFRTAKGTGSLTKLTHTKHFQPFEQGNFLDLRIVGTTDVVVCPPPADRCDFLTGTITGTVLDTSFGVIQQSGTETLLNSLVDTAVPYVTGAVDYVPTTADTLTSSSPIGGGTIGVGGVPANYVYKATYTTRAWSLNTPFTYSVLAAYFVDTAAPMKFLLMVQRTGGTATERGLFLFDQTRLVFRTVAAFRASTTLRVLTCNKRHAIWIDGTNAYLTALYRGLNGQSLLIGTDTQAITPRFRLLDPRALFDAKETVAIDPAGFFPDAYEADDTPTLVIAADGSMPIRGDLIPFEKLAIVPAGIALPVTPNG